MPVTEKKQLESLLQASAALHSSIDLPELLRKMIDLISGVLECSGSSIYVFDQAKGELVLEADTAGKDLNLKIEAGPRVYAAGVGVPVHVRDSRTDKRWEALAQGDEGPQSVLCVPMQFNGQSVGVIEATDKKDGGQFDYDDLQLFQGFANICGAAIINARRFSAVSSENRKLKETLAGSVVNLIGNSTAVQKITSVIKKVAHVDSIVLITGESGTGKEIIARSIHALSDRKDKPFIPVNCGAVPENLLESELFGHEKGAFTGADRQRAGIFEEAEGGTVFLDEIGETSLTTQVKLLRVLQEGAFKRVGSNREIKSNVRVISATNRKLEELVAEKKFREDLYYRINVVAIPVPPLRERMDDLPVLAGYFLKKSCEKLKKNSAGISPAVMRLFFSYEWKGNVRELENTIESAVAMSEGSFLEPGDLPVRFSSALSSAPGFMSLAHLTYDEAKDEFEKQYFSGLLQLHNGDVHKAAEQSKVSEKSIVRRRQRFDISKNKE
ncbi:MAG: hypothetical protein A2268_08815 [Candidatus Raymondbacteria bacterium RifOxyA12_full_50_37]|nr:MAG: hypothetical protein A2350_19735 [Candidatus Raymondbacteria bacterium RifOxyB12_full_50_8]OGJ91594.1 MAG: hypothetical protein A2268_08815 [Candidatus Raymondbacteria bacterium RifOxyA12_full_50_37]OGJ92900.1 MAG: hypothetical protein A2248_08515 [Candidatus Raymondbacteria bacterium RIFOXYA2_FULL_49_16]OGJ94827.1 MAG: hypothetical protein A2487_03215 [Candidatus Raymondbacteria bacterium RifOxyC12_full_50_8]OGP44661.1 MAG: hypothetical protein A2324_08410 [Candidatus Raymondbacteria b